MIINPSFRPTPEVLALKSDTPVWTLRLLHIFRDPVDRQLCGEAWTTEAEARRHFWVAQVPEWEDMPESEVVEVIQMTIGDYLAARRGEFKAMNVFEAINVAKFEAHWDTIGGH